MILMINLLRFCWFHCLVTLVKNFIIKFFVKDDMKIALERNLKSCLIFKRKIGNCTFLWIDFTKVLELKVCIFSCLFTFPVAKFCQILKKHLGKELCPGQDLNPGPLAYEASVLPFCHGHFIVNLLKVEKLFQFLFTLPVAKNCQKNNATFLLSFASSTLIKTVLVYISYFSPN